MPNHYLPIYQSSAQNPFRAEDFCSIIIETRPTEKTPRNNIHYHIFCFVHQCSVLHSFGQKQKIVLDFYLFCSEQSEAYFC